jgi:hypothetical protein
MGQEQGSDRTTTEQEAVALLRIVTDGSEPAVITAREWAIAEWRIYDTHRAITELEKAIRPAMESISSGKFSLASMLLGKR